MPAQLIAEAIDVFKQGGFHLPPGLPQAAPNQLDHEGFEEGFHDGLYRNNLPCRSMIFRSRVF
jgi:hypothetical protein